MKLKALLLFGVICVSTLSVSQAQDVEILQGDDRLACEAILCLSSGNRPTECNPSLKRYFGISHRKWKDTVKGRVNFLSLCPAAHYDQSMKALVSAIGNGQGRCEAGQLNALLRTWTSEDDYRISNSLPSYCRTFYNHSYTYYDADYPVYVGTPDRHGYWVRAADYDSELKAYNARIERENRNRYWN